PAGRPPGQVRRVGPAGGGRLQRRRRRRRPLRRHSPIPRDAGVRAPRPQLCRRFTFVTTVHIVGNHAPAKSATGATDGTDPAAGDMFAALMAALLPQATAGDMSVAGLAGPLVATASDTNAVATATAGQGTPAVLNLT